MTDIALDNLPGFRRRIRITPTPGQVICAVEDDIHCMAVTLHHDGATAIKVEADMRRVPWTTCPGAQQQLTETFTGVALKDFPTRGGKKANCTHLYDLAQLAASHAGDESVSVYDILVSDRTADGKNIAELRLDKQRILGFVEDNFAFAEPPELAGMSMLGNMEPWLSAQSPQLQEADRLLRWGMLIAHGRSIPLAQQSDATSMPPNCFTFQPERAVVAVRVGKIKDFSGGQSQPLEDAE